MTATPKVLYRAGDRVFSDTLYVCPNGDIAIYHGSLTITKSMEEWHAIGYKAMREDKLPRWKKYLINLLSS